MDVFKNGNFVLACQTGKDEIKKVVKDADALSVVLENYDSVVSQAIEALRASKTFEGYLKERGLVITLPEFIKFRDIVIAEEGTQYEYEEEK